MKAHLLMLRPAQADRADKVGRLATDTLPFEPSSGAIICSLLSKNVPFLKLLG